MSTDPDGVEALAAVGLQRELATLRRAAADPAVSARELALALLAILDRYAEAETQEIVASVLTAAEPEPDDEPEPAQRVIQ